MSYKDVAIETERLRLVPIESKYREEIFREFTKTVTKYMFPQPTGDIKDIDAFIQESLLGIEDGTNLQLVFLKKNGEFLGCGGLHHTDRSAPEMGIWIKESSWGNGYGREAMRGVKDWADRYVDYEYILYPVAKANRPSQKIAESLGGQKIKEFIGKNQNGEEFEEIMYHIFPSNV